ncbi:helix-turn-helix transcriptional regulator [Luteolibacter ambystomatis]|uniref:Helix-turn-helix transcriptional regulator n=1 Tax=Luteolibacter ambystomatis TaxID=2824561 RepID=A0A975G9B3_9BACT|nr:helix-turn-helix transcriptional regulator [Luteolibacter ambystomatis]QUE51146.1 helix-turn-helix transcriptional regulator [Luteolibacter ambystomatis]
MIPVEEITATCRAVAAVLRKRRESLGLTKTAVAQRAGINNQTVTFIEDCVNIPTIHTLLRFCWALDTTPEAVFKEAKKTIK